MPRFIFTAVEAGCTNRTTCYYSKLGFTSLHISSSSKCFESVFKRI